MIGEAYAWARAGVIPAEGIGSAVTALTDPVGAAGQPTHHRLMMLDGWRALSILSVLAAHMLPLGAKTWGLNEAAGVLGMAMFFTLSGFLIVSILQRDADVGRFLVRRVSRIVPLAWTVLAVTLPGQAVGTPVWIANFFFYANLPPFPLAPSSGHFWSLGVEVQFYLAIALAVLLLGRRGLWLVPIAAVAVTAGRIATGTEVSIVTWLRLDEILAGGILAQAMYSPDPRWRLILSRLPFWPVAVLAALSALSTVPSLAWLDYARPYLVTMMIGRTVVRPVAGLSPLLVSRPAAYVATISYALYIVHPFTMPGWLGSGTGWAKYAKRPLCFAIAFGVAHLSTFYFERRFIAWSHGFRRRSPTALGVAAR